MDAFDNGEDGFWKVTGPILSTIVDFIRKHQRTIPHFNSGYLNYNIRHITPKTVHLIARKILNHDYNANAALEDDDEASSHSTSSRPSSVMEVEKGDAKENGAKHTDENEEEDDESEEGEDVESDHKQSKEVRSGMEAFSHFLIFRMMSCVNASVIIRFMSLGRWSKHVFWNS